ncbi:MAG: O-antigen ligase family protein [Elusimicrobiota bacterium]|jgi:O-antigen ligase/Tfp pilus assembly protein PilF|nr:O-antigen ligase family protein [Elusimicrobiota bacterium]
MQKKLSKNNHIKIKSSKINEKNKLSVFFNNFGKFWTLILLTVPFLFFLKNITRNPYHIQQTIFVCVSTLIFFSFVIGYFFDKDKEKKIENPQLTKLSFANKFILTEKFLFLFFLVCLLSLFVAFLKFPEWRLSILLEGEKAFILIVFNTILVYLLPFYIVDTKNFENILWKTIFFTGILASIYGILQFFDIELFWNIDIKGYGKRAVSTFGNPNFFSSFLIMLIPIGIYFSYYKKVFSERIFYTFSVIIFLFSLICTMTRSSWLGFFISILFYYTIFFILKSRKNNKYKGKFLFVKTISIFLLIFVLTIPFIPFLKNRIKETINLSFDNRAIYQRLLIWNTSKDMFLNNKITGVGWGLFEVNYPFYQSKYLLKKEFVGHRTHGNNAHNELLEILTQTGIIGFLIYILFFLSLFNLVIKSFKKSDNEETAMFYIAYLASIIGMLLDNMFNNTLHIDSTTTMFWFIVANLIKKIKIENFNFSLDEHFNVKNKNKNIENKKTTEKRISKIIKLISLFFILIFLIFISVRKIRFFIADKYYSKSYFILENENTPNSILLLQLKQLLEKSKKLQKYEVNKLYELAKVSTKLGLLDDAIKNYSDAILANPSYEEFYFGRGSIYYRKNAFENAQKNFLMANFINPLKINTIYGLFSASFAQKNYEKCLEFLKKGEFLEPDNYYIVCSIGAIYSYLQDFESAKIYYEKALQINPEISLAPNNLKKLENKKVGDFPIFKFE